MKANAPLIRGSLDSGDDVGFFLLVHLSMNNEYLYTTLPYEVVYNGNVYSSDDCIIQVMPPVNNTVINRNAYSIQLSGLNASMLSEIQTHIVNSKVKVDMGFTVNGEPQLNLGQTLHVYSGYVSQPKYEVSGDTVTITLELTSPLADLDSVSTLFTTRDGIKSFNPNDTSFDMIYEGSSVTNIKWGKR